MEDQRVAAPGAVRPSDADREAVESRLKVAVGEGRLTLEEFADRMGFALSAESSTELATVTADLPAVHQGSATPGTPTAGARLRSRIKEQRWLVAVMGEFSTSRRWRPARTTNAVAVMGGGEVDLRTAEIEGDEVTINVVAVMGGVDVIVPRGVDVEMSGFAVMGGRDCTVDESALVEGAPLVRVNAYAVMGGIDVRNETDKEARKRAKKEAKAGARGDRTGSTAAGESDAAPGPHTLHRTPTGPQQRQSWWGRLALAGAAVLFVMSGGPGAVAGGFPDDGFAMMGGGQLDLTQRVAQAEANEVVPVSVGAIMGGYEVIVPPGTEVRNGVIGFMGGSNVEVASAPTGDIAPGVVVEVDGFALMGGVNITDDRDSDEGDDDRVDVLEEQIETLDDQIETAEDAGNETQAAALETARTALQQELDDLD